MYPPRRSGGDCRTPRDGPGFAQLSAGPDDVRRAFPPRRLAGRRTGDSFPDRLVARDAATRLSRRPRSGRSCRAQGALDCDGMSDLLRHRRHGSSEALARARQGLCCASLTPVRRVSRQAQANLAPVGEPEPVAAHCHRDRAAPVGSGQAARGGEIARAAMTPLMEVLDLARWAPSGDNSQPWRFAVEASDRVAVFGRDTRADCVYDLDGHPSQISLGALLETITLAATRFGLDARIERRQDSPDERPIFDIRFRHDPRIAQDALVPQIRERRVQRRALRLRRLSEREKETLERAVKPGFQLVWFEGWTGRLKMARLNFANAKIRLTTPEAYSVHREVIEWGARLSADRIPDAALGASAPTLMLMRWAMRSWQRVSFLNRYLAGTLAPRVELDFVPGIACAAHCVLAAERAPATLDDYVAAGRALQRFWLTATSLGLQFQPQYTPLVFARYAREGVRFTTSAGAIEQARRIRVDVDKLRGPDVASRAMFMGRIGAGKPPEARSIRLPLERLMHATAGP